MLIKRPLVVSDQILSGFKIKEWEGLKITILFSVRGEVYEVKRN